MSGLQLWLGPEVHIPALSLFSYWELHPSHILIHGMIKISRCENPYALRTECSLSSYLRNVLSVFFIVTQWPW